MGANRYFPTIVLRANSEANLKILQNYAEFWKIPHTLDPTKSGEIVNFSSGSIQNTEGIRGAQAVICPSGPDDFRKIASEFEVKLSRKETLVRLPVTPDTRTAVKAEVYEFSGPRFESLLEAEGVTLLSRIRGTRVHLLCIDIVGEYSRLMQRGLEDPPSLRFRIASKLPRSYQTIPSFVRSRSFRTTQGSCEATPERLGPIECLRTLFLASLVVASEAPVSRIGFWRRGKRYALAVTHDVESKLGLEKGTGYLLEVERGLGLRSTWNIVTERYSLATFPLAELSRWGEVSAHDTKHDGRLVFLTMGEKTRRLKDCKQSLEESTKTRVRGFRSPLLQHDRGLIEAVGKAGYEIDSSVPSWEALSPTSLKPHGVGTVFPFSVEGVLEVPLSLPQDHQLIRVAGMSPGEARERLVGISKWIRELGGCCVLLIHPDYEFSQKENIEEYSQLLEHFVKDDKCDIMTMGELADWWTLRSNSSMEILEGRPIIRSRMVNKEDEMLETQIVTGYSEKGFRVEPLC